MESCDEILLQGARNGDHAVVRDLLEARKQKKLSFNLDCKGRTKSNYGWTPLHLASYFGHEQVAEILLQNGAHVDVVNEAGDTPLHKASFTGREPLVMLLLRYNADVCIINGEGQLPKDVALHEDVRKLLEGAERADIRRKEQQLFQAAREGNLTLMNTLLHSTNPPNINCTDPSGNTALHCAAYREQKEAAVILLQNGIDSTICNNRGQTALQLAQSPQMKQILDVQPIKKLIKHATRFEGNLLKRSRFLGWQNVWVVLERGVLTYFKSRADSCSGVKRKGFKHLDEAKIVPMELEPNVIIVHFSDNTVHRLAVPLDSDENHLDVQKWINAFQEHVEYCTHYMSQGKRLDDSDDEQEMLPLGSMQDALQTAQAHQHILQNNISSLSFFLSDEKFKNSAFTDVYQCLKQVTENARLMMNSLQHCLTIFTQQEEIRHLQLKQEQEKCRVLEDALHVLAKEHHELEQSITSPFHTPKASRSPRFYDTSDDEFYDAFEGDSDDSVGPSKSTSFSSLSTLVADNSSESKSANGELLNDVVAKSNKNDQIEAKGTSGKLIPSQCLVSSRSAHMSSMDSLLSSGHYYSAVSDDSSSQISVPKAKKNISRHMMNEGRARSHKKQPKVPVSTWQGRSRLPVPMFARNDYSVWSILKQCIGKELTKITMPIIFNEPLSFLQRLTEYMEYAYLLNEASRGQDPIERLEYVAAFAISALASNWDRVGKPFNPLLGETYELERDDFRVICEQVSHHPPISAFHADSPNFVFHGSIVPKLKFWGKSVEVQPKGLITVELPGHDEMYTWHNVNCCVHNIIVGKLWIEQYGVLEIVNHKTGHKCVLNLKPAGWFSKDLHKVEGFIMDRKKKRLRYLYGKWTDLLKSVDIESYEEYMKSNPHRFKQTPSHEPPNGYEGFNSNDGVPPDEIEEPPKNSSTFSLDIPNSATLWEATPRPPDCDKYYQFTLFSMTLNDMLPGMREKLAPTDSRFRPDIRKLEEGDIDGAAAEKNRLEEKQRDARKSRKKAKEKENWKPKWFKLSSNPHTKEDDWIYTGGYWERDYSTCPDIF